MPFRMPAVSSRPLIFVEYNGRFLLGFSNGIEAVARVLISEICGTEHVVVGMGFVTGSLILKGVDCLFL